MLSWLFKDEIFDGEGKAGLFMTHWFIHTATQNALQTIKNFKSITLR